MENVQFEEGQNMNSFETARSVRTSALTRLFIKIGLAKDQKQADTAMIVITVLCVLITVYFIISTFFPTLF
jgi:hypothetical protein